MNDKSNFSNLRILVIDDDTFFLNIVKITLNKIGIPNIDTLTDVQEVISNLKEDIGRYDIILSDLNMPNMDGIELLRELSKLNFRGGVVLLTAEDLKVLSAADRLARSHSLYLLGVLSKPIDKAALITMLESYRVHTNAAPKIAQLSFTADEIMSGLESNQFTTYFQPQVDVTHCKIVSMEGLARWKHPQHGVLPAGAFIDQLESFGLAPLLNQMIIRDAITQIIKSSNTIESKVSLNVSMDSLCDVSFPDQLQTIADDLNFPLGKLILEVTESQFMGEESLILDSLIRLRLKGITLAIDDFGTGYSNLAQIKHAPVSELKIDRSLVLMAAHDDEGKAILATAIEIGKKLELAVVVEGIENISEWNLVHSLGADIVQGYFVARPMPLNNLIIWYENWNHQQLDICKC